MDGKRWGDTSGFDVSDGVWRSTFVLSVNCACAPGAQNQFSKISVLMDIWRSSLTWGFFRSVEYDGVKPRDTIFFRHLGRPYVRI